LATNRFSIHRLFEAYDDVSLANRGLLDLQVTKTTVIIAASHKIRIMTRHGEGYQYFLKLMEVEFEESEETDRVRSVKIHQRESL
jgi:hypothetical protein